VSSVDEAIQWVRRAPFRKGVAEVRPLFTAEDFAEVLTPELPEVGIRQREATGL
jgi:hypothetical protein